MPYPKGRFERPFILAFLGLAIWIALVELPCGRHAPANLRNQPAKVRVPAKTRLDEAYGQIPLSFEANQGQADPQAQFLARGAGYSLWLTPTEAVLTLRKNEGAGRKKGNPPQASYFTARYSSSNSTLRMRLKGAHPSPK